MRRAALAISLLCVTSLGAPTQAQEQEQVRVPLRDPLSAPERRRAEVTLQLALETRPSNLGLTWNETSGNRGSTTPIRTYKTDSGVFCRDFREIIILADGAVNTAVDTACRDTDGVWKRLAR